MNYDNEELEKIKAHAFKTGGYRTLSMLMTHAGVQGMNLSSVISELITRIDAGELNKETTA